VEDRVLERAQAGEAQDGGEELGGRVRGEEPADLAAEIPADLRQGRDQHPGTGQAGREGRQPGRRAVAHQGVDDRLGQPGHGDRRERLGQHDQDVEKCQAVAVRMAVPAATRAAAIMCLRQRA
jgi:hypothetical protein